MLELRLIIPEKTSDAEPLGREVVVVRLNRCRLPRCQCLLDSPWKDFCSDPHRSEFHNKFADAKRSAF